MYCKAMLDHNKSNLIVSVIAIKISHKGLLFYNSLDKPSMSYDLCIIEAPSRMVN